MKPAPIKRHLALQPVSRQHHEALQFCWKIKSGIEKEISAERMWAYAEWFFEKHIASHFEKEEKYIFPIAGNDHILVKQALDEHVRLKHLFTEAEKSVKSLDILKEELQLHIRFEERVLFNEIQDKADEAALKILVQHLNDENLCSNWQDEFWSK